MYLLISNTIALLKRNGTPVLKCGLAGYALSQKKIAKGIFICLPLTKTPAGTEDDPMSIKGSGIGARCSIDLANAYRCPFIASVDIGKMFPDAGFQVLCRLKSSDKRG